MFIACTTRRVLLAMHGHFMTSVINTPSQTHALAFQVSYHMQCKHICHDDS